MAAAEILPYTPECYEEITDRDYYPLPGESNEGKNGPADFEAGGRCTQKSRGAACMGGAGRGEVWRCAAKPG